MTDAQRHYRCEARRLNMDGLREKVARAIANSHRYRGSYDDALVEADSVLAILKEGGYLKDEIDAKAEQSSARG